MQPIPFAKPLFTFPEALAATGADNAWLRTFIQRDKAGLLGTKHRTGRLLFSLKDVAAITILWHLNAKLRVAPSAAWEIVDAAGPILTKTEKMESETIHVAFDGEGDLFIWTVDGDGVLSTWNDNSDANMPAVLQASVTPHIILPMQAILVPLSKAAQIAQDWPEDAR